MAEKNNKDKNKKEASGGSEGLHIVEIIFGILILLYLLHVLSNFFGSHFGTTSDTATSTSSGFFSGFSGLGTALGQLFIKVFPTLELLSIFISFVFIMGIIYTVFRMYYLRRLEGVQKRREKAHRLNIEEQAINPKWQRVIEHINSPNPADWRLAILEADILLGDMLEKMGYRGEGIGEMLKSVEKSDFNTIDNAWEAHKIRNAIAHEGADFMLSQREAQRAIGLYESVFEEFHSV